MDFPASISVAKIDAQHPAYKASYYHLERLRKLSEGGQTIETFKAEFLRKRPMEASDVYTDRLREFAYINYLASILGWYTSALFKQPPNIILRGVLADGTTAILEDTPETAKLLRFADNCDGQGHRLVDFWQQCVLPSQLLYRRSYVLFDLPSNQEFQSRAEQEAAGALQPHLVAFTPQDVINWQVDEQNQLLWAIVKVLATTQDSPFDEATRVDRWYLFSRDEVAAYEAPVTETGAYLNFGGGESSTAVKAQLVEGYPRPHALADSNQVPLFVEDINEQHWIGNRILSPLVRLLNLENSHDWSLEQSNLAQLTVFSEKELDTIRRGEAHVLQLGPGDKVEYLEPSGRTTKASQERINELREDIFRLAYLVAQGRSSSATASMQSGYSKEQDMLPARDVLSALGDHCRGSFIRILQCAADRMDLKVQVDVQGFDFSDRSDVIELEVFEKIQATMEVNSQLFWREMAKRVVRIGLPDANRELLQAIDGEIVKNPTPDEAQQAAEQKSVATRLGEQMRASSPRIDEDVISAAV